MKFGLSYNTAVAGTDPANLKAIARHADDLGFESFYVPEHITLYPGARIGEVELAPDLPIADPLECLAFVAGSTTTILLGTGVLLLPFHPTVVLAKRLATIDVLSSGRMRLFTIGVSSLPGEAAAVGVDYATRGRRADEAIKRARPIWESPMGRGRAGRRRSRGRSRSAAGISGGAYPLENRFRCVIAAVS
jgi:alkanesulfonate monooxygenase SsuD/methylene tetrahydromethanopterin reductase-like flavin-dependent oxidoreductase (luciferase family)